MRVKILAAVAAAALVAAALTIGNNETMWDHSDHGHWPSEFQVVEVPAPGGGTDRAYFLSSEEAAPLLVSLHTWSGDYAQEDPLARAAAEMGWNYIHPNAAGPNNRPEACLSDLVIESIDAAIDFAREHGRVDEDRVMVVGVSGGGYTALGAYLRSRSKISHVFAWVPISDLDAWYWQSKARGNKYADDIAACVGGEYSREAARSRSPLHWNAAPPDNRRLSIFAGINDGYTGSVPVSHSTLFFEMATQREIGAAILAAILSRGMPATNGRIGDRSVIFYDTNGEVDLTIFDGGHEMLVDHQIHLLRAVAAAWRGRVGSAPEPE